MKLNLTPQFNPRSSQNATARTLLLAIGGAITLILAIMGIMDVLGGYSNNGTVRIKNEQTKFIGSEFVNYDQGMWLNEGECHYQWDITNEGIFACGDCQSGVTFIDNNDDFPQAILGTQLLEMYDVVLNNAGDLFLAQHMKLVNSCSFIEGVIVTNKTTPSHFLHFVEPAVYSGDSDSTHVNGYVARSGSSPFVFPIGDGSSLRPVKIAHLASAQLVKAAYFSGNPSNASLPAGAPFDLTQLDPELETVYNAEYWDIDGEDSLSVTLYWEAANQIQTLTSDLSLLTVAGWDGSKWMNLGQQELVGSPSSGRITSNSFHPGAYLAYTFAKINPSAFPVTWAEFTAERIDEDGHLRWVTSSEQNSSHFEIERSLQASSLGFSVIASRPAAGNSATPSMYTYTDPLITNLPARIIYYRIKQIDRNGSFTYSPTRQLYTEREKVPFEMVLFPNPVRDQLTVKIGQGESERLSLELIDARGRLVYESTVTSGEEKRLDMSGYSEGGYFLKILDGRKVYTKPVVKR